MTFAHMNTNKYCAPIQIHWLFVIIAITLMTQRDNPSIFTRIGLSFSPNMRSNYFRIFFFIFATRI